MTELIFQMYTIEEWIVISALFLFFLIQLYFILNYFLKTLFLKPPVEGIFENHISVVVPVRNEEEKIEAIIKELLSQNFSSFELIMVDDHSMDRTFELLFSLTKKYKNVKYTGIAQDVRFSEKMNINLGMKAAKAAWIVFADAEVPDRNAEWLRKLNSYLDDETDAVVGYSNIVRGKGLVRFFFRIEKMWQFLQGAAFTLGGKTLITDQNNVVMRKKIYFDAGGFRKNINKHYANLELILNEKIDSKRVRIATGEVAAFSAVDENYGLSFRNLIKKSLQIRKNLSWGSRLSLLLDEYSRIALIAAFTLLFIYTPRYWEFAFIPLFTYLSLTMIILGINQRRLKEQKIFLSSLVYILIRPLLILLYGFSMFKRPKR